MDYYQETFDNIGKNILHSPVLYVDETPINMRFESGYAWVMTNAEEVISFYKSTRDGDFIKEYLANYKGILVSDFYSVYDTINCLQQKCLLHLIRDLNDDLLKNPFDDEFKAITKSFTAIMQDIVVTIDKYGLKRRHLNKHNKIVAKFFEDLLSNEYRSDTVVSRIFRTFSFSNPTIRLVGSHALRESPKLQERMAFMPFPLCFLSIYSYSNIVEFPTL